MVRGNVQPIFDFTCQQAVARWNYAIITWLHVILVKPTPTACQPQYRFPPNFPPFICDWYLQMKGT